MQGLLVVLAPVVLMLFVLTMQRLEINVARSGPREDQVEEFLLRANPDEMSALVKLGFTRAMAIFNLRCNKDDAAAAANVVSGRAGFSGQTPRT